MTTPAYSPIEAAGGVLWRPSDGIDEVALVHRPAYDDWSLPKGKANRGEHPLLVAMREVHEETACSAVLGLPLPDQRYLKEGRPKTVHLHAMQALEGGALDPEVEVDEVRWMPIPEALRIATWDRDRVSLQHFLARRRPTSVVVLLRHASAGERKLWSSDDRERPLDAYGEEQSRVLNSLLVALGVDRVVSSPTVRCVQTVASFGAGRRQAVETFPAISEDDYDPDGAEALLSQLLVDPGSSVMCTHGPVLGDLIDRLCTRLGRPPTGAARVSKGGAWLIHTDRRGGVVELERMPAPSGA